MDRKGLEAFWGVRNVQDALEFNMFERSSRCIERYGARSSDIFSAGLESFLIGQYRSQIYSTGCIHSSLTRPSCVLMVKFVEVAMLVCFALKMLPFTYPFLFPFPTYAPQLSSDLCSAAVTPTHLKRDLHFHLQNSLRVS